MSQNERNVAQITAVISTDGFIYLDFCAVPLEDLDIELASILRPIIRAMKDHYSRMEETIPKEMRAL